MSTIHYPLTYQGRHGRFTSLWRDRRGLIIHLIDGDEITEFGIRERAIANIWYIDVPERWDVFVEVTGSDDRDEFLDFMRARLVDEAQVNHIDWCRDCDAPTLHGAHVAYYDEYVCEDCRGDYFTCDDCGDLEPDHRHHAVDDRNVCDSCFDSYGYCEYCEEYFHVDDTHEHEHENECDCPPPTYDISMPNGDDVVSSDERFEVSIPEGVITHSGLEAVSVAVWQARNLCADLDERDALMSLSLNIRSGVLGTSWRTKEGNFTKRVSRSAYKESKYKVPDALLTEIGNVARRYTSVVPETFALSLTRDINGDPDDFAHGGSCWWTDFNVARCILKSNGGLGLRSFGEYDQVLGRAWVLPVRSERYSISPTFDLLTADGFVVFNGYGNLPTTIAAQIVSNMTGWNYREIYFHLSDAYVNGDVGFLVAKADFLDAHTRLSLDLDHHSNRYITERNSHVA